MKKLWVYLLIVSKLCFGQDNLYSLGSSRNIELKERDSSYKIRLKELAFKTAFGHTPEFLAYNNLSESIDSTKLILWLKVANRATFIEPLMNYLEPDYPEYTASKLYKFHPKYKNLGEFQNFFRWLGRFETEQFVLINVAANTLTYYKNNQAQFDMKVIVGTKKNQTPLIATSADAVILYPYWTATRNISINEILPKVKTDSSYLFRNNFQVLNQNMEILNPREINWQDVNSNNFNFKFRQGTGCDNALGLLKINIENPLSIYLHDVPHQAYSIALFERDLRFFSHGCIRLAEPLIMANTLEPKEAIDKRLLDECLINQKPKLIELKVKVPVFIMYFTDYIDNAGEWKTVSDYYGLK